MALAMAMAMALALSTVGRNGWRKRIRYRAWKGLGKMKKLRHMETEYTLGDTAISHSNDCRQLELLPSSRDDEKCEESL